MADVRWKRLIHEKILSISFRPFGVDDVGYADQRGRLPKSSKHANSPIVDHINSATSEPTVSLRMYSCSD